MPAAGELSRDIAMTSPPLPHPVAARPAKDAKAAPPVTGGRLRLFAAFIPAALLEAWALSLAPAAQGVWHWLAVAGLHLAAAAVLPLVGRTVRGEAALRRYYYNLSGLFILFIPVLGILGSFLALGLSNALQKPKGLAEEFERKVYMRKADLLAVRADDLKGFLAEEMGVEPIRDILDGNDVDLKRGAVTLLRNLGTPEAVKMLRLCLTDEALEVRYSAHSALTVIEEGHTRAIAEAKDKVEEGEAGSRTRLGLACLAYATSGLPEEALASHYLESAREALGAAREESAKNGEDTAELDLRLGEIALRMDDRKAAAQAFDRIAPDAPQYFEALLGLCRLHYDDRDYASLARDVARLRELPAPPINHPHHPVYRFWTEQ